MFTGSDVVFRTGCCGSGHYFNKHVKKVLVFCIIKFRGYFVSQSLPFQQYEKTFTPHCSVLNCNDIYVTCACTKTHRFVICAA